MRLPDGFRSAGVASGIKADGVLDLGVLVADAPARWAGAFTTNAAAAAPVLWSRARQGRPVRAIVVNSGNANACTGPAGDRAVSETAEAMAGSIGCDPAEVLVASTGPIGVPLPLEAVTRGVDAATSALTSDGSDFARSILTTDSCIKVVHERFPSGSLLGIGKGAAMIAPSMATMLAFLVTDLAPPDDVEDILRAAVDRTFNRITIDGCESTNDSVFLLAGGAAGKVPRDDFAASVERSCADLARQIVADAEGGTKVIEVTVTSATDEREAMTLGRAVAESALWKTAANGSDPNWGRVVAALGGSVTSLDLRNVTVSIGPEVVFSSGAPAGSLDVAAKVMAGESFSVVCDVGRGGAEATIITVDLSAEYVRLNSEIST